MSKTVETLDQLRHSAAHILAQAVLSLYPDTKYAIGPSIAEGFYYDFEFQTPIQDSDLEAIEKKMKEIVKEAQEFKQYPVKKDDARVFWQERDQPYKLEILEDLEEGEITFVENGPFIDLCRGNHVANTKDVAAVKLLSIAGAYWRGSEKNKMLTRIYGTAFGTPKELETYLQRLEEAKKRDHRKLGKELGLFSFHDQAPGMPFYHPKGFELYNTLVGFWREEHKRAGYQEIKTPMLLKDELWRQSGHYDHYRENMFFSETEHASFAVKPMNCPGGTLVYRNTQHSYRDLPLRLAELGLVHRRELSGVLHGLFRVNAFTIDDAHIFCTDEMIRSEISDCIALILKFYQTFGFQEIRLFLSTKPVESMGSEALWTQAEGALEQALRDNQMDYQVHEGGGAFYGPKIDFEITDSIGRQWQCGTIQLDFQMPERFDMIYMDKDNQPKRPVMIHRAVFGSIERFYGILVEHYGGAFPVWLAPLQVRVLSIADRHIEAAQKIVQSLMSNGIRVDSDLRSEKIGYKIREAELQKIPYIFVLGDKEIESGQVAVRQHGRKDLGTMDLSDIIKRIQQETKNKNSV